MKADAILNQLLRLRRLSERRALETLLTCDGERRRAEQAAEEAAGEAARHLAQAKAYERKHIESFAGQPVSENAIRRFRASLDALMEEQQRLRAVGEAKQQTLRERLDALEEARASFRMRQNAVNKLDHLVTQQAALTSLQQAGLAEAADEEQSCGRPVPPASGN